MEYNYATQGSGPPNQAPSPPPGQAGSQQTAGSRPRGRRQYAAQQYDFNAPAPGPMYQQQQQYPAQGYQYSKEQIPQGGTPATVDGTQQVYAQPQMYPQPGYQYGQGYQTQGPHMYQASEGVVQSVPGMANQFQHMHVTQVVLMRCSVMLTLASSCEPACFGGPNEYIY